jgi:zinc/manganese transport system substrate-binding protein
MNAWRGFSWQRCLRGFCLTLVLLLSLCTTAGNAQPRPLRVVATFSILGDLSAAIGGERIDLHVLVGPDSDGHVYQPTPADSRLLREADLVIANGLGFEGWMERLVQAAGYRGELVIATAGLTPLLLNGKPDPHAWQSVANVRRYVRNISAALIRSRPDSADYFNARQQDYLAQLDALEAELEATLSRLPAGHRSIVTNHDAFAYFGRDYGLRFLAPVGLNTDSEASALDMARLIRQIRAEGIGAVFVENITDARLLQRLADESGARIGGVLYSDALSPPDGPAPTYLALMRHNLRALASALAPPSPQE